MSHPKNRPMLFCFRLLLALLTMLSVTAPLSPATATATATAT